MANYIKAINYVLDNEGGYVNNPRDPGGPTKYGITLLTLTKWRGKPCTASDIENLSLFEAQAIYKKRYWDELMLGQLLSDEIATALLDTSVNRGKITAVKYAQAICGCNQDGGMGPNTLRLLGLQDPNKFLVAYAALVKEGYQDLISRNPPLTCFQKGWFARADRLLTLQAA